jgi:hypothetical protein
MISFIAWRKLACQYLRAAVAARGARTPLGKARSSHGSMESATLTRPTPGPVWLARLRAAPASAWAKLGFAALCAGALVGFFLFPTYPTYDSFYALIWGREILHLHVPQFHVYRSPTEHPLAVAFGVVMSVFGQAGARLMIVGAIGSFVALAAGLYRLGRLTFGPVVGLVAVLLLLTRFDFEYLAAQGYLDFSYMALIVWAGALEAERPRCGLPVFVLLAAAGLLRPEAWLLSGVYFLWCAWRADRRTLAVYALLTVSAPLIWAGVDTIATGDPAYSLHSTTGLAEELGRTQGLANIPGATWQFMLRLDKLPLVLGAVAGLVLSIVLVPRRVRVPLVLLVVGLGTFGLLGAAGTSVIDRYLLLPAVVVLLFCALALGGWSLLEPGGWLRRAWMLAAVGLVALGAISASNTLNLTNLRTELAFRNDSHRALAQVLNDRTVRADLRRCGPLSLPNHKLIPDARWILDASSAAVIARAQARADAQHSSHVLERRIAHGVAIYPTGDAVFRQAIVDVTDDPRDQVPPPGWQLIRTSQYYAVYARC